MDWRTGRGDSARRCPPRERTAGFLTADRGRQDKPGFNQLQAATGPVVATGETHLLTPRKYMSPFHTTHEGQLLMAGVRYPRQDVALSMLPALG